MQAQKRQISITLDASVLNKVRILASEENRSLSG